MLKIDLTNIPNKNLKSGEKPEKYGIYVHVPFCVQKCRYCGFYSLPGCGVELMERYVRALKKEAEFVLGAMKKSGTSGKSGRIVVDTVFIGGGTPSLLPEGAIPEILECISENAMIDENAEISIESNPGTLAKNKLDSYAKSKVNRISMGAQSFDDSVLRSIGRIHDSAEIKRSFAMAREAGFKNINLDLMFALPGQSRKSWEKTLKEALALSPEHLSFYSLQLEEGTPMFEDFKAGRIDQIPDEDDRAEYHAALRILREAGYEHYEISNAAKLGAGQKRGDISPYRCRHNLKYWHFRPYIGLGAGASSFTGSVRYTAAADIQRYIDFWEKDGAAEEFCCILSESEHEINAVYPEIHENTLADSAGEFVFTALRTREGVNFSEFERTFDAKFDTIFPLLGVKIKKWEMEGLVKVSKDSLSLTEKGIDISNCIMSEFVSVEI